MFESNLRQSKTNIQIDINIFDKVQKDFNKILKKYTFVREQFVLFFSNGSHIKYKVNIFYLQ